MARREGGPRRRDGTRTGARQRPATGARDAAPGETGEAKGARPAARRTSSVSGMGLGTKFAVLVGALISMVVIIWGVVISRVTRNALEREIIRRGVGTAKAVSLYGRTMLEANARGEHFENNLKELDAGDTDLLEVAIQGTGEAAFTMKGKKLGPKLDVFAEREVASGAGTEAWWGSAETDRGTWPVIQVKAPITFRVKIDGDRYEERTGTAMVLMNAERVDAVLGRLWRRIAGAGVIFLAVGVAASIFLGAKVAAPAKILVADMDRVANGDYDHGTSATSGDEFGQIAAKFNYMTWALKELREKEVDVGHQLDSAREIQASLLPNKIPRIPGFDVFPYYRAAKEVGGDYYDFFPVDRERLAMLVADVSGKGIPGSMVMTSTRTILRMLAPQCGLAAETVRQTNKFVAGDIARGMFVTAMFAILNVHTREMVVCSAGHNPMVLYRERTGECELVNPKGMALGFDKGPIFDKTLEEYSTVLETGDRVVMYTDGVVEAMDADGEEYGEDRLYSFVKEHARMQSKDFVTDLVRDLDDYKGDAEQHDDITIVTLKVLG